MKKHLILFSAIGLLFVSLSACKGKPAEAPAATETVATPAETTPAAPAEPVAATTVVNSIEVPTFASADATMFCDDYKKLMEEYASLKGTGDKAKAAELSKKFMTWAAGASTLGGKIKPEEMQKFNDFMKTAEAKFNEMNTAVAK